MTKKVVGRATTTREIRLVNPIGRTPMAKKKSTKKSGHKPRKHNPSKKSGGGHHHQKARKHNARRRHHRRHNPSTDGMAAAIAGGAVGRLVRGAATSAAHELLGHNRPGMGKTLAHATAALTPAVAGYLLDDMAPNMAKGMAGTTGAALVEVGAHHFGRDGHGRPPSWLRWLIGPGQDHAEMPNGGMITTGPGGQPMYTPPATPGMVGPPAPVPVPVPTVHGPVFTLRTLGAAGETLHERQMRPYAMLPGNEVLVMNPRTREFDTIRGIEKVTDLRGVIEVKGIVEMSGVIETTAGKGTGWKG